MEISLVKRDFEIISIAEELATQYGECCDRLSSKLRKLLDKYSILHLQLLQDSLAEMHHLPKTQGVHISFTKSEYTQTANFLWSTFGDRINGEEIGLAGKLELMARHTKKRV